MRLIRSTYLEDEAINQTGVGYWGESLHKAPSAPDICRQGSCAGHCAQGFRARSLSSANSSLRWVLPLLPFDR